jgi:integrase
MTEPMRRRRPKGSGGIRNRGTARNPRWFAYHDVLLEGEARQITKGPFRRKSDAEDWLRTELQRSREGRPTIPSKMTVSELLNEWLATRKPAVEPSTYGEYVRIVENRLKPHLGRHKVKNLQPAQVGRMFTALRQPGANRRGKAAKGLSETSLQHTHAALRTALDYAIRQRIIAYNVMDDVDRPRRQATRMGVWSPDELARFLRHVNDDRLAPLLRLASHTGARRSELLGLCWPELDLDAATMSVAGRRTRVGYEMIERAGTKTAAGARVVDLDPVTVEALKLWKKAQEAERLAWVDAYVHTTYVFTTENGEPVHADHVSQRFERLVADAGVPPIRFHDMRHTHATLLLKAGVPPHVVAQRLGHSSPALTLSIYSHVLPRQQSEAAAAFAKLVEGSCDNCGELLGGGTGPRCGHCQGERTGSDDGAPTS